MCFWIKLLYENILTNRGAEEVSITGLQLRRGWIVLWWLSSLLCSTVTPLLHPPQLKCHGLISDDPHLSEQLQTHGLGLLPELKGICGLYKYLCPKWVKVRCHWRSHCSLVIGALRAPLGMSLSKQSSVSLVKQGQPQAARLAVTH